MVVTRAIQNGSGTCWKWPMAGPTIEESKRKPEPSTQGLTDDARVINFIGCHITRV